MAANTYAMMVFGLFVALYPVWDVEVSMLCKSAASGVVAGGFDVGCATVTK